MIRAGIDWGSSSFRAYRFDASQNIIDTVNTAAGLKSFSTASVPADSPFERYLFETIGDWLEPGDTVLLSGMVTSRTGWQETPYLPCPADLASMMEHAVTKTIKDINLIFLPGLSQRTPSPDVIRGEELQMLGASKTLFTTTQAASTSDKATLVMPGTHSKWALVENDSVQRFHTIITGELFEILTQHSLVGAFANDSKAASTAFTDAVRQGFNSETVISDLFSCRAGVLLNTLNENDVKDRLSGLLIGHEIREGLSLLHSNFNNNAPSAITLGLIGSDQLCSRYLFACQHLSLSATQIEADASALGFRQVIHNIQH